MLRSRLEGLQRRHSQLAEQERELYTDRIEEAEDVENLEGRSLARYFYSLFGSLDERLDKGAHRGARRSGEARRRAEPNSEDVETEMASVERELSTLAGCERRYDELLERKAEALKASGTGAGARLREIERELSQVEYRRRETEEAMNAGRYAESAAEDVINCLSGASTWGVVDMFSDSVFADMAKYSHIDNAQRAMERLRSALRRFGAELEDVGGRVDVSMGDFMGFADVFFDNVFVDHGRQLAHQQFPILGAGCPQTYTKRQLTPRRYAQRVRGARQTARRRVRARSHRGLSAKLTLYFSATVW